MKISIISKDDIGGAGIFAVQLLNILKSLGYETEIICIKSSRPNDNIYGLFDGQKIKYFLYKIYFILIKYILRSDKNYLFFEITSAGKQQINNINHQLKNTSLIFNLYTSGLILPKQIKQVFNNIDVPIIFYPVDMNLFTGGCHYSNQCIEYKNSCEACPALPKIFRSIPKKNLNFKLNFIEGIKHKAIISSSSEQDCQIRTSKIFKGIECHKILMSVDDNIFGKKIELRNGFRKILKLDKTTILLRSSSERRKGADLFIEAVNILLENSTNLVFDIITIGDDYIYKKLPTRNIYNLGFISDKKFLSEIYLASDLFVNASLADSGPMMISESLMSGTPVITTPVGLSSDLIKNSFNGEILSGFSAKELADTLGTFLKGDKEFVSRAKIRNDALDLLSNAKFTEKIDKLVKSELIE